MARLTTHLTRNKLLPEEQHSFTKRRLTTTAIVNIVEYIIQSFEGDTTTSILLNYSRAFDCISNDMLMEKLAVIGIQDLASRKQALQIKNKKME